MHPAFLLHVQRDYSGLAESESPLVGASYFPSPYKRSARIWPKPLSIARGLTEENRAISWQV